MTGGTSHRPGRLGSAAVGLAGLVAALAGCARQEMPRGGEPDRAPPVVLSVDPEPMSTTAELGEPIRIRFNERISEQAASGRLEDLVMVSPDAGPLRVRHRRDALEVRVPGGLRPGLVYRVTVLPGVRDLFRNVTREPFEFVFSTGGEFHPTAAVGLAIDRVTGQPLQGLVVQAVDEREAGSERPIVHATRTDSAGVYALRYLPPGRYSLVGFQDRNRNRELDPPEPRGRATLELGPADTLFVDFPVLEPDTVPPRLTRAEVVEPDLVRLTFTAFLEPEASLARVGSVIERADGEGPAPAVLQLVHEHRWVEVRRQAAQDAADAATDTTDTPPARPAPQPREVGFVGRAQGADTANAALLGLVLPSQVVYAELADTLDYDVQYVIRLEGATSITGVPSAPDSAGVTRGAAPAPPPEAPVPDTGAAGRAEAAAPRRPASLAGRGRPPDGGTRVGAALRSAWRLLPPGRERR